MAKKRADASQGKHALASKKEQELCVAAVQSGEYDDMPDSEWVVLCEKLAHEVIAGAKNPDN